MRRSTMIIIISITITITIMMMASACAPRSDGFESVFRERLVRHYAEDDKAARTMNGEPLRLDITFVDLDGDGTPEAIVRLDHPAFCGSRGCAIDVVSFESGCIIVLGAFIAHEVTTRREVIGQQRYIVVDGHVWTVRSDRLTTE